MGKLKLVLGLLVSLFLLWASWASLNPLPLLLSGWVVAKVLGDGKQPKQEVTPNNTFDNTTQTSRNHLQELPDFHGEFSVDMVVVDEDNSVFESVVRYQNTDKELTKKENYVEFQIKHPNR